MHTIRHELMQFLHGNKISHQHIGNMQLAITEILTNLIKHPTEKTKRLEIRALLSQTQLELHVMDNSTPFFNFDTNCKSALARAQTVSTGEESGYGLGCILSIATEIKYTPRSPHSHDLNCFTLTYEMEDNTPMESMLKKTAAKKIFLIDDDPISLQIHHHMLNASYEVIDFDDAREALNAFTQHKPDLIISDLTMPEMDGIALRKALSNMPDGNTTPFIFLSGHAEKEHSPFISQLGVDNFLCKPVTKEQLNTVLTRLLQRSEQIRASVQGQFNQDISELLKPSMPENYGPWNFIVQHQITDAGGGDFILYKSTDSQMTTILADVMGHGKQAKFFSCVYAGYLHSLFRLQTRALDSSGFLKYLSQAIDGDTLLENMIMTCQCFQFMDNGILKISTAGHPSPMLLRPQKSELINITGPLPGMLTEHIYEVKSVQLNPGDKVLFMTDGFIEGFSRSGSAVDEILRYVGSISSLAPADLASRLWSHFQNKQQQQNINKDDATIIIAEYKRTT